MKPLLHFAICFFVLNNSFAQTDSSGKRTHYYTEAGTFIATSNTMPFWLRANQYGIVPDKAPILTFRGGYFRDYDKLTYKKYDWGYGIDAAVNVGASNKIYLPEAYIKVKLNKFEFYAGRRREIFGLVDTTLTSGSYIWSGNALPMPKIQLSIPDYLPIKFTNNLIAIKGGYAHGWFDNQGVVKDFYLHQKWLYARLGKPNWKVKMYAGFNHQVQWGGYSSVNIPSTLATNNKFPSSFADYIRTVTGISIKGNKALGGDTTNLSSYDKDNRIGNHLGSIDLGIEINFENAKILLYRQNIYDSGTLYWLTSIADGLNGISWHRKNKTKTNFQVTGIGIEFLYTKSQGGDVFNTNNSYLQGQANYFNHGQYIDGWSYQTNTIGTPFITPYSSTNTKLPAIFDYDYKSNLLFNNNRVSMWNMTLRAENDKFIFTGKFTYSSNAGTYAIPFSPTIGQFSSIIGIYPQKIFIFNNYRPSLQISVDEGDLYAKSLGIFFSIKKDFYKL